MKRKIYIILFVLSISLGLCECLCGFENKETHPALTDKAVAASVIDDYLKTQLEYSDTGTLFFQDLVERGMSRRMTKKSAFLATLLRKTELL